MEESSMETGQGVPDTEPERPTLPASLAQADPNMAAQFNGDLIASVKESSSPGKPHTIADMSGTSIQLAEPTLKSNIIFEEVVKVLVDHSMKIDLEETGVLNWLHHVQKLAPLKTMGDGNCLLHALALAMWGVEDSSLILRRLLYIALVQDEEKGRFRKRWQRERISQDSCVPGGGFQLENSQWDAEWDIVVKAAEDLRNEHPSHFQSPFKSLEEIHIFVMANILKRPIIVLAEHVVRSLTGATLAPNNFSGMYLPLLWDPEQCIKSPIVLGFSVGHFAPLIRVSSPGGTELPAILPIVRRDLEALTVHFLLPHEENAIQKKLYHFLALDEVQSQKGPITGVRLLHESPSEDKNLVKSYITKAQNMFKVWKQQRDLWKQSKESKSGASLTASGELTELSKPSSERTIPNWQQDQDLGLHLEEPGSSSQPQPEGHPARTAKRTMCVACGRYVGAAEFGGKCSVCFTKDEEDVEMMAVPQPSAPTASLLTNSEVEEETPSWRRSYDDTVAQTVIPSPMSEEHSMINVHCKFATCKNFTSKFTYPYCHEHSRKPETLPRVTAQPVRMVERCVRRGCDQPGDHKLNNYCTSCFLKQGLDQEFEEKCRISACTGTAQKEYDNYCSACHQRVPLVKGAVFSQPEQSSTSLTGAAQKTSYERSMYETPTCVNTGCNRPSSASNYGACDECFRQQMNMRLGPEDRQKAQECRTPGCTMYGRPESQGYCSKCYKDAQTTRLGAVQYGSGNIMVLGTPEVIESTPVPTITDQCRGHHCPRSAVPGTGGFCLSCSHPKVEPPQPVVPHVRRTFSRQPPDNVISKGDLMGRLTQSEPIPSKIQQPYVQGSSLARCKIKGCDNYANPMKYGYCNECYLGVDECDFSKQNRTKTSM